ncbi:hypothetical protein [Acinetobacter phage Ab65]|nr:hypothetical protein [Acinetobacter phage Ab69]WMC00606.1 hypothetical protein [Acinetobacter phage Ab65]
MFISLLPFILTALQTQLRDQTRYSLQHTTQMNTLLLLSVAILLLLVLPILN